MFYVYEVRVDYSFPYKPTHEFDFEKVNNAILYSHRETYEEAVNDVITRPVGNPSIFEYLIYHHDHVKYNEADTLDKAEECDDYLDEYFENRMSTAYFLVEKGAWTHTSDPNVIEYGDMIMDDFCKEIDDPNTPFGINPNYSPCPDLIEDNKRTCAAKWILDNNLEGKVSVEQGVSFINNLLETLAKHDV